MLGSAFTLLGLVMSLFIAIGQTGLIAANADDRTRDGAFSSETGIETEPKAEKDSSTFGSGRGDPGGSSGTTVSSDGKGEQGGGRTLQHGGASVQQRFLAATPGTYNQSTGAGGSIADTVTTLNGGDFQCGDKVVFFMEYHVGSAYGNPGASLTGESFGFAENTTGQPGAGYVSVSGATIETTGTDDQGTPASLSAVTTGDNGPEKTVTFTLSGLDGDSDGGGPDTAGDTIVIRMVGTLGCTPGSSPTGVVQARHIVGGSQTINLTVSGLPIPPATVDLGITKTPATQNVADGGVATFTVTVTNHGNATATGVSVTDVLPTGLTFNAGASSAGCAAVGQTVTCTPAGGTLAASASAVFTIAATETGTACSYQNSASTSAGNENGTAFPNVSATVDVTVTGCVPPATSEDVTAHKFNDLNGDGKQDAGEGDLSGWTMNVWDNNTCTAPTLVASGATNAGGDVTFTLPYPAGGSATYWVSETSQAGWTQTTPGSNCVQVTISSTSGAQTVTFGNRQDTIDLTVTKSPANQFIANGGTATFTLIVTNSGNTAAANVTVSDDLPTGLTSVTATFVNGGPSTPCPGFTAGDDPVTCNVGTLGAGASATVTITVDETGNACRYDNAATVSTTSSETDTTNNSSGTVTVDVLCVTINKSGPGSVPNGSVFSYTVTVQNFGQAAATGIVITDDLDDALTGVTASIVGGTGGPTCSVGAGNVVTCSFGLASASSPNDVATITIGAVAPFGVCPTIQNQATGVMGAAAPIPLPPSGVVTTVVTGCGGGGGTTNPAIAITKTANPATVPVGSPISFTIGVTSFGSAAADNVVLTDTLPTIPGTTWSISSQPAGNPCSLAGNVLTCSFGTLTSPPATTVSVTVTTTNTTTDSCGTYTNTASATARALGAVQASATATVECPGGLQIVKDGPALAHVGDTITYTFAVSLIAGSPPLSGVTVSDPICDLGTMTGPTGDDGDGILESGETWGYSCTHLVKDTDPDPLPNTATACGTGPAGVVCASDNHEVDVIHPAIEIVKEADPTSGTAGTVITYTYTVTNSGDVPLFNVSVDDNVLGHICTIPVLPANTTVTCIGTYTIPAGGPAQVYNVAIAGGTDPLGVLVEDEDDETIDVVAGATVTPTKSPPSVLAFTGPAAAIPLGGLALVFLTVGTALLWAGRRRGRHASMLE